MDRKSIWRRFKVALLVVGFDYLQLCRGLGKTQRDALRFGTPHLNAGRLLGHTGELQVSNPFYKRQHQHTWFLAFEVIHGEWNPGVENACVIRACVNAW